jgi:CheY-like chemotaxis protein
MGVFQQPGKIRPHPFTGNHFDIIVSDIEMPVMNGIELNKNVPLAYKNLLSSNNLKLLRKPNDILELQLAVQQVLQKTLPEGITN